MKAVAILETMWGAANPGEEAPRYFRINPSNHSGKRLYKLLGENAHLLVTNACKEYVTSANEHGIPDPEWLKENLALLDGEKGRIDVLLVCGKVAQNTFRRSCYTPMRAKVIEMPHPAARFIWNPQMFAEIQKQIPHGRAVRDDGAGGGSE